MNPNQKPNPKTKNWKSRIFTWCDEGGAKPSDLSIDDWKLFWTDLHAVFRSGRQKDSGLGLSGAHFKANLLTLLSETRKANPAPTAIQLEGARRNFRERGAVLTEKYGQMFLNQCKELCYKDFSGHLESFDFLKTLFLKAHEKDANAEKVLAALEAYTPSTQKRENAPAESHKDRVMGRPLSEIAKDFVFGSMHGKLLKFAVPPDRDLGYSDGAVDKSWAVMEIALQKSKDAVASLKRLEDEAHGTQRFLVRQWMKRYKAGVEAVAAAAAAADSAAAETVPSATTETADAAPVKASTGASSKDWGKKLNQAVDDRDAKAVHSLLRLGLKGANGLVLKKVKPQNKAYSALKLNKDPATPLELTIHLRRKKAFEYLLTSKSCSKADVNAALKKSGTSALTERLHRALKSL